MANLHDNVSTSDLTVVQLDVNDPQRQFETFVPYLALSCPILLHAILAFSACHLSRLDGSCDHLIAENYHDLCVQRLIPALADPSTTLDNVLPISTVVLRMYEMMIYETDHQRHLRGCSALFQHNRRNIGYRALKRTAFWTYFREEIMVALSTRKPTTIRPSNWKVDITWSGDTDFVKTEKMTMLTAEVVDHCFGEDAEVNPDYVRRWDELQCETDAWKESLPETFNPLYVVEGHRPFPEITYACTWHSELICFSMISLTALTRTKWLRCNFIISSKYFLLFTIHIVLVEWKFYSFSETSRWDLDPL